MKRTVFSLFFCFQSLLASIHEYKLNDIRVVICDDFFLPIAKVGVFYSVGLNHLKNVCEAEIIQEKFLSKNTKISAKNLGTNLEVEVRIPFSEVSAVVSNNQVTEIIKIILNNEFDPENLELTKDQLKISQKISEYFETNITGNEIYAAINSKRIFNRSILDKFTVTDLKNYIDMYKKSSKTIVICGNLDTKKLKKELHLTKSDFRKNDTQKASNFLPKTVELKSKFLGRSLYYIYKIDHNSITKNYGAISSIINNEMFDYFKKYSQLIDQFFIAPSFQLDALMLGVNIRKDVSKKSFEANLRNFFNHLKKAKISQEKLKSMAQLERFSEINENENIFEKYSNLVNRYVLYDQSRIPVSEEILKVSSEDIKNFIEQIIENNFIMKISTQYKADN